MPHPKSKLAGALLIAIAILPPAGCTNRSGLTVRSIEQPHVLYRTVPTAGYFMRTPDGGYEAVLVHDPFDVPAQRTATGIAAVAEPPLRQVVHLRILWRPRRAPQEGERLAANASIDWRLFGIGVEGEVDYLHYQGAGFVTIDASGDSARILIRQALIRPVEASGRLADPLGPSQLRGSVMAQRSPEQVARTVELLRQRGEPHAAAAQGHGNPSNPSAESEP